MTRARLPMSRIENPMVWEECCKCYVLVPFRVSVNEKGGEIAWCQSLRRPFWTWVTMVTNAASWIYSSPGTPPKWTRPAQHLRNGQPSIAFDFTTDSILIVMLMGSADPLRTSHIHATYLLYSSDCISLLLAFHIMRELLRIFLLLFYSRSCVWCSWHLEIKFKQFQWEENRRKSVRVYHRSR